MNKSTRKLIISAILTVVILLVGMVVYQRLRSQKGSTIAQTSAVEELRKVELSTFLPKTIQKEISIDGRLQAYEVVDLFAEVTGPLRATSKPFKEGTYFSKGDLLFDIDDEDAKLNLLAQRASLQNAITQIMADLKFDYPDAFEKWKTYLDNFDFEKSVANLPEPSNQQERYFIGGKNLHTLYYQIKSLESKQQDYKIYAPFSGVVTQANTFTGALVNPGANLGTLMNTARYEVKAPIQLEDLEYIKSGQRVKLVSQELGQTWNGRVSRISQVMDERTQNLPIYISVSGRGLRTGMYLTGSINGADLKDVYKIPESLLFDQDQVLTVQDSVISSMPISVVSRSGDDLFVQGLSTDSEIVTSDIEGLYIGQRVSFRRLSPSLATSK
ncbi:MAG: HlyD family efflux transporter periplasmic adaptor subunit [Bacteroidota bacterium]